MSDARRENESTRNFHRSYTNQDMEGASIVRRFGSDKLVQPGGYLLICASCLWGFTRCDAGKRRFRPLHVHSNCTKLHSCTAGCSTREVAPLVGCTAGVVQLEQFRQSMEGLGTPDQSLDASFSAVLTPILAMKSFLESSATRST